MSRVVLILGAGPNIGVKVAEKFAQNGYQVAIVGRSLVDGAFDGSTFNIAADLQDPEVVLGIFQRVEGKLGMPNVVIFNGGNRLITPPDDPLSASLEILRASRSMTFESAYVATQEALKGFRMLPDDTPTAFIYTGNALNQIAIPATMPYALGKVSAAMMIEFAANAYGQQGYRFYYADERQADGRPANLDRDGVAHAEMYWTLANEEKQSKWQVTFVKGQGRRNFVGVDFNGETRESYDHKFGRV
ncbi:hypothetical protein LTR86_008280 [Recurvomyces mirabilis]|nr:hypothetical protein LTR86_008280 [Recurvomyces mirabilis]